MNDMDQAANLRNIVKKADINMKPLGARVITVTSGKGGVGKSNVSVNLAIQFKKLGKRVIIFDADFGLANVEVIFGIVPKYNMFDMIYNNKEITEVLTSGPLGIEFISGGSGVQELLRLDKNQLAFMIEKLYELDRLADIIIIDTGAGISDSVLDFVAASSEVLLVTTPEPTSITDAYAVLKAIKRRHDNVDQKLINLLVNRTDTTAEGKEIFNKLNKVTNKYLDLELTNIGYLPNDKHLVKAVVEQKPVSILFPKAIITKGFEELADRMINGTAQPEQERGLGNLFTNILRLKKFT
ncbi:MinD/ParA family protein [Petrocella sp. FN5]|uniref:MinD/ParA family protein n=1 Tax=Petrocella sp. FN5 TaxID=3032002 RepID=UPI0023D9A86D|nr:MinD/ParA family protein [Petrocella sp. FN5]MDF1616808.1 MinD/ParA family protein [Petrocella sp. FN5]